MCYIDHFHLIHLDNRYLAEGNAVEIPGVDDAADFAVMRAALSSLNFSADEQSDLMRILAAIIHLGNVEFKVCYLVLAFDMWKLVFLLHFVAFSPL